MPGPGADSKGQPIIVLKLEFYYGIKGISKLMQLHAETVKKMLREGKIPGAKKDATGRWVLSNVDYLTSLQG